MSDVKGYELHFAADSMLKVDEAGRFVLASDYDALAQRCAELEKHVTEWFCNKCRTVHAQPSGLDLACKTPGCSGLLRPSSYEQRRVEVERDTLRAEVERLTKIVGSQAVRRCVGKDQQREIDELVALGIEQDKQEIANLKARLLAAAPAAEVERLRQFVEFVRHAPVSSGVCCCGDNMDNHPDPMNCGHSAVDEWDYALIGWLKELGIEP